MYPERVQTAVPRFLLDLCNVSATALTMTERVNTRSNLTFLGLANMMALALREPLQWSIDRFLHYR